jgi:hypothetical protein
MTETEALRLEKLSLLIGCILGQIAELLNYMKREEATLLNAYKSLNDIHVGAGIQIHELYYKGNKP